MGFISTSFDIKRFARSLRKTPVKIENAVTKAVTNSSIAKPVDLPAGIYKMYIDLLRNDEVNIRSVDFSSFTQDDLCDFYEFLENYDHGLFEFGETIMMFQPAVTTKRIFI